MKVRVPVLLTVAALVLLAVVAARGSSGIPTGTFTPGSGAERAGGGQELKLPDITSEPVAYGAGLLLLIIMIGVLIGLGMFLFVLAGVRIHRTRRIRVPDILGDDEVSGDNGSWLARATRRALSEMDHKVGGPPSDAVIAAWVQLEESAAATGIERQPHQTPTEFTAAVLARQQVDENALRELKTLYHRARFGTPGNVTAEDAAAARRALERIS